MLEVSRSLIWGWLRSRSLLCEDMSSCVLMIRALLLCYFSIKFKTAFKEPRNIIQPRKPCIRADRGEQLCACAHLQKCVRVMRGTVRVAMCGEHLGI